MVRPMMLAFYMWLGILYFTPDYFEEYSAEIINTEDLVNLSKTFYYDMDGDGISEKVKTDYHNTAEYARLQLKNLSNDFYNQWLPKGNWLLFYKPIFGDYNNNGFSEIYYLTIEADSIFMNINELMLEGGLNINNRFICKAGTFNNGKTDIVDWGGKLMDINSDGFNEYVFSILGGFSKFPRNTFAYYINSDSLIISPPSASGLRDHIKYMDLNGDGVDEITGNISSPENIHYQLPYTDSSAWLMVIDPLKMDFQFPPIRLNIGIGSRVSPEFYNINGKKYIAVSVYSNLAKSGFNYLQLKLFDINGKLLKSKNISNSYIKRIAFVNPDIKNVNRYYLIDKKANIYWADTSLNLKLFNKSDLEDVIIYIYNYSLLDVDGNGDNEVLFFGVNKRGEGLLQIYTQNLKVATSIVLPEVKYANDYHYCLIKEGTADSPYLMVQASNMVYDIKYRKSPYYYFKYPAYLAAYFILYLFFWLLQKAQNKLALRRFETERQLMQQQLTISKNQLEPHFMLNTLNNIGYMFSKENKEDAQYYFGRFASLIHRGLKYADKTETSLFEELEFVKDYLILQKRRFNDELEFTIAAEDNIDLSKIKIPHSLIFTFVENAVKHGLRHKHDNRRLSINIRKIAGKIEVVITDNGIGRMKSRIMKTAGTGKGISIVANIVEGYNKLYNSSISYKVKDLVDERGDSIGTEVRVVV